MGRSHCLVTFHVSPLSRSKSNASSSTAFTFTEQTSINQLPLSGGVALSLSSTSRDKCFDPSTRITAPRHKMLSSRELHSLSTTTMVARKSQPSRHSAHCPTIATNENMFTIFKKLPPELRNRVWSFAANNEPRTLDIASTPFTSISSSLWSGPYKSTQSSLLTYSNKHQLTPHPPVVRLSALRDRGLRVLHPKIHHRTRETQNPRHPPHISRIACRSIEALQTRILHANESAEWHQSDF